MLNTDKIYFILIRFLRLREENIYILFMQVGFLKLIIPYLSYYN